MTRWTLALSTGGAPCSVALAADGDEPREIVLEGSRPDLARLLLPAIDQLVRDVDAPRSSIQQMVVAVGPGSYTGLRVAVATARTLAAFSGATLTAYSSSHAMAAAARTSVATAVVLDALRGDFAVAHYGPSATAPREWKPPRLVPSSQLRDELSRAQAVITDAPGAIAQYLAASTRCLAPTASAAALIALLRSGVPALPSTDPIYLRASAAEENAARPVP
ncbi:MAG: tRNA (adenosine(37)-N6)-threonylcarbamoyltransferase complex dimerization subunit type 1 TsaB [Planctomycetes bacterium]|nr:tRNA (adenosine(37)-N6)-threonylcarbamoyltransferase complex dimerization subunit type 1 TsaB [Planctomycetota bacterium]